MASEDSSPEVSLTKLRLHADLEWKDSWENFLPQAWIF
jgi:hypothetical protein